MLSLQALRANPFHIFLSASHVSSNTLCSLLLRYILYDCIYLDTEFRYYRVLWSECPLLLLLLLSRFSRVQLCATPWRQPIRLCCPWDSPGKNTGVGCHFLLRCVKVKSESEVAQSCPTLSDPMDWSPAGSSVHGIFQARVLEWGAIAFSHPYVEILMSHVMVLRCGPDSTG